MDSTFGIIFSAVFVSNIILSQFLGLCSFLGVSKSFKNSVGMCAAVSFVMFLATALAYGIYHDNAIVERIALKGVQAETKLSIPVKDGTIKIRYDKNGAWVESSPCPDKICVHQGKITKPGETAACVPEKVLLAIEEPAKEAEHEGQSTNHYLPYRRQLKPNQDVPH